MGKANLRQVGAYYEQMAVNYLREKGYEILEQNYRIRQSEIDIIAKNNGIIIFIEVKYRKTSICGAPGEAVTYEKQRRISKAAAHYLLIHGLWDQTPCRFDVIEILDKKINHIEDAFLYVK